MLGARTPPHSLGTAGCRWPPPACGRRARRGTENTCSRASLAAAGAATGAVSDSCELAGADTEWEFGRVLFSEPDIKDRLLVRAPATLVLSLLRMTLVLSLLRMPSNAIAMSSGGRSAT